MFKGAGEKAEHGEKKATVSAPPSTAPLKAEKLPKAEKAEKAEKARMAKEQAAAKEKSTSDKDANAAKDKSTKDKAIADTTKDKDKTTK